MITKAQANIEAVSAFAQSVSAATDYSGKLDRGIACLEELFRQLSELANALQDDAAKMTSAQEMLAEKIKSIEEIIAKFTAQINSLEEILSGLEEELANTPESISLTNANGEPYEISNPAYAAIRLRISAVEGEIDVIRAEMYPHQIRLERANSVNSQITAHKDAVNGVIYSLQEKKNTCKQLLDEINIVQKQNLEQGTYAVEALKKIQSIIQTYLKIKMVYENAIPTGTELGGSQAGIIVNININKTIVQEQNAIHSSEAMKPAFSEQDIKAHAIAFDSSGRLTSFDGKSFGGQYNSYDDRLSRSSADDNPIWGYYEGTRGESKFIPSKRTVEGVVVTDILGQYGLDGVTYRNAEPDFEPCSEAVVTISAMTKHRDDYYDADGELCLGNKSQADIELAKAWNLGNREGRSDWSPRDVKNYREANRLTWHEKCDTTTMVLVRSEINLFFKHSGGCSECRVRDEGRNAGGGFDD